MKVIYLHHANRDRSNPPTQQDGITEVGRKDAELTAQIIGSMKQKYNIVAIYTSTFYRCTETADIVNAKLDVQISLEPRFNEFKSMGEETWKECQERTMMALKEIIYAHKDDEAVICVTSGLNIAPFISLAYGVNPSQETPFIGVPSCSPLIFDIDRQKVLNGELSSSNGNEKLVLTEFDPNPKGMYDPNTLHEKNPKFPKTCVSFFSYKYMQEFVSHYKPEIIAEYGTSVMPFFPVYKINYKGEDIAVVQAFVGEPLQVGNFEELICMGVKNFLLVGSCGCLGKDIEEYSLIVPTSAIRDEGTSFHYLPASNEVELEKEAVKVVEDTLDSLGLKYIKGKTWTTDAIFRETKDKVERRRNQGAITVDMECAGMAAVAKFRNVHFAQVFYGADDLSLDEYDARSIIDNKGLMENARIIPIGIECAYNLARHFSDDSRDEGTLQR